MQRVGDREIRAKMAELRMLCDKEIEIQQHRMETVLNEALRECEEKHKRYAERREEIEDAISWYNKVLGFRIERGLGTKFIFTNINMKKPNEEYFFTIRLENDSYYLLDCNPHVTEVKTLIQELNVTNGLYNFIRVMRTKFQEASAAV